jgi:hypothetical protein
VTAIDVPEAEIEHFRAAVKTIPGGSVSLTVVPMESVTEAKAEIQPEPEIISQEIYFNKH